MICVPDSVAGYTCVGMIGVSNGGNDQCCVLNANTSGIKLKNIGSTTVYPTPSAIYLYKKND